MPPHKRIVVNWASTWMNHKVGSPGQYGGSLRLIATVTGGCVVLVVAMVVAMLRSGGYSNVQLRRSCLGHQFSALWIKWNHTNNIGLQILLFWWSEYNACKLGTFSKLFRDNLRGDFAAVDFSTCKVSPSSPNILRISLWGKYWNYTRQFVYMKIKL